MRNYILVFMIMVSGCAVNPSIQSRPVQLNITSNLNNAEVYLNTGNSPRKIGSTQLHKIVQIPNIPTTISVSPGTTKFTIDGDDKLVISPDQIIVSHDFQFLDTVDILSAEFDTFSLPLKKSLVAVIDNYSVVASSPRYLVESKGEEAKSGLNQLLLEFPDFKTTKFYDLMKKINYRVKLSVFLESDEMSDPLDVAKKSTGQI